MAVRTERSEVSTKTTEGQHSVRLELARVVSSLSYGARAMLVLNLPAWENKNTQLMTVSMEMIRMAKSRSRKNQSKRPDSPQDYHMIIIYHGRCNWINDVLVCFKLANISGGLITANIHLEFNF